MRKEEGRAGPSPSSKSRESRVAMGWGQLSVLKELTSFQGMISPFVLLCNFNTIKCSFKTILNILLLCCTQSLSCVRLFAIPWTVARQAPLSMGILQARIPEWAAIPSSRGSSRSRDQTLISALTGRFLTTSAIWNTTFSSDINTENFPSYLDH